MADKVAYGWKKCDIDTFDVQLEETMTAAMERLSNPWQNINKNSPCRKAWRINGNRCTVLPDEVLGHFHMDDVYILLVMRANNRDRAKPFVERHVHVWIGKYAIGESYQIGFAWANRLDSTLGRDCVIYREVQGMESPQFQSYFNPVTYFSGTFKDSYWMRRLRNEYQPARMLKLYKPDKSTNFIVAVEVPCRVSELDPAFTFVLDVSHTIYLWHGNLTPSEEDLICTRYVEGLRASRGLESRVEALDDDTEYDTHEFFTYLSRDTYREDPNTSRDEDVNSTLHRQSTLMRKKVANNPNQLFKVSITKSKTQSAIKYEKQKERKFSKADVDKNNISIINTSDVLFIVMSKKANKGDECTQGLKFAHDFLKMSKAPLKSVTVVRYKQKCDAIEKILSVH